MNRRNCYGSDCLAACRPNTESRENDTVSSIYIHSSSRLSIVNCGLTDGGATAVGEALKANKVLTVLVLTHVI